MEEITLPTGCICGYQAEIERLRAEVGLLKEARQRQRDIVDVFLELTEDQEMDTASMLMLHRAAGRPDDWEKSIYGNGTNEWLNREPMTVQKWLYPGE